VPRLVVGILGGHDKTVCLQERFRQFVLVRGSLYKFKLTKAVVQAGTELLEGLVDSEFFEVSINTVEPGQKVFSAVHALARIFLILWSLLFFVTSIVNIVIKSSCIVTNKYLLICGLQ
jgi:hypothetical protein